VDETEEAMRAGEARTAEGEVAAWEVAVREVAKAAVGESVGVAALEVVEMVGLGTPIATPYWARARS